MKAFRKDFIREITKNKGRFISVFFIVLLGAAFFSGIRATRGDMELSADTYYDEVNLMDVRVISTLGLVDEDLEDLEQVDGVEKVAGGKTLEVLHKINETEQVVKLIAIGEEMNLPRVLEGRMPENEKECLVDVKFLENSGCGIGDEITFTSGTEDPLEDSLERVSFTITGTATLPYYMDLSRGTGSIGDGGIDSFVLLMPEVFTADYYTEIYVQAEGTKEMESYGDEYQDRVDQVCSAVEALAEAACQRRYDHLYEEGSQELEDAKKEVADGEQELIDAEAELKDGDRQIREANETIAGKEQEIEDGAVTINQNEKELEDGWSELLEKEDELQSSKALLLEKEAELESGQKELDAQAKELKKGKAELEEKEVELESGKAQLYEQSAQLAEQEQLLNEKEAELKENQALLEEKQAELDAGRAELEAKEQELSAGKVELEEKQAELASAKEQLSQGEQELQDARSQLEQGKAELESKKQEVVSAREELEQMKAILGEDSMLVKQLEERVLAAEEQLSAAEEELSGQEEQLLAAEQELESQKQLLAAAEEELLAAEQQIAEGEAALEQGWQELAAGETELDAARQQLAEGEQQIADARVRIADGWKQIEAYQAQFADGEQQLSDARAQIQAGEQQIAAYQKTITEGREQLSLAKVQVTDGETQLADAKQTLLDGQEQLADAKKTLEEGRVSLSDAKEELAQKEQELADGWKEYEEARAEALPELEEAKEKIADGEKELSELEVPTWYVWDRTQISSTKNFGDDAGRIANIGKLFPLIFFLVAALVSLTTMTRMIEEQRQQIGTLKALGYSDSVIAMKYFAYAMLSTISGAVVGVIIGEKILPWVIMNAYGMLYTGLPYYMTPLDWYQGGMAILASAACTGIATLAACYHELSARPAELMRPEAPKNGKRIFLERIRILWRHLNFTQKSTVRNLIRYKKRFFMTVIGIGGCMGLIVVGFGLQDSITAIAKNQFVNLFTYQANAVLGSVDEAEKKALQEELSGYPGMEQMLEMYCQNIDLISPKRTLQAVLEVPKELTNFKDFYDFRNRTTGEKYEFPEQGAAISEKTADLLGIEAGDVLQIKMGDHEIVEVTITVIVENYVRHFLYISTETYQELFGELPEYNQLLLRYEDTSEENEKALGEMVMSYDCVAGISFTTDLIQEIEDMLRSLDIVICVLIISAGLLAFVVLYNLNNINITERQRELATLKVLGFYDKEVASYVYRENMVLTLIGIVAGMGIGSFLHQYVIQSVEVEMMMFGRMIFPRSYLWSALITLAFALFVNFMMYYRLKKIDMIESLKSVE
ncbi:MAG: FtsX-like permease family protein [Fusicatenibacter sp.]|nr:FtsX-like permease family protein [Fusicatenibacter sp.]